MPQSNKKSRVTAVSHVRKADTKALVVNGTEGFPEDSFIGSYWTGGATGSIAILEPTFKPATLQALVSQNNTLLQCIAAMEVNVDGTGYSIEPVENAKENETEKKILEDFFKEPYYGDSFVSIRRKLRVDLETCGNAYLEVIRNVAGEVVMMGHLSSTDIRLLRYDDPVVVNKQLVRSGKEITVQVRARERRFVQMINGKKTYFKEFGASREIDRTTGEWAKENMRLPIDKMGSEILHLTAIADSKSPYGLPRWVNQLPSVLGSRKAEEFNLEFFDAGGLPPVLVLVQGGYLGDEVKDNLVAHLSNTGNKHRAVVVEAISSSGSMDSAGSVQVKVERFGSERQSDSMFQNYDKNAEEHVRCSFRLPPMFIGKSQDYNFATAYTAYMVAEAQVFDPERVEFDQLINNTVVKALGVTSYKIRSLPLTLVDVQNQIKAIELVSDKDISGEEKVSVLNEITGLSLQYEKQEQPQAPQEPLVPMDQQKQVDPSALTGADKGIGVKKLENVQNKELSDLADKWLQLTGLVSGDTSIPTESEEVLKDAIKALQGDSLTMFNDIVAAKSLVAESVDGAGDLCNCATHLQSVYD